MRPVLETLENTCMVKDYRETEIFAFKNGRRGLSVA